MFPAIGGAPYSPTSFKLIRLLRKGCANRPFYHIAVVEASKRISDPIIEQLGSYDPLPNNKNEKLVVFNFKRIEYWLKEGARPTPSVQKLLGLCGYFPIHYWTFRDAWENRKMIKEHLENLRATVAEIERNQSNELSKEAASNLHDVPKSSESGPADPIQPKN